MKKKKGKLIVIDGLDGSGKATQTKLLIKKLKRDGHKVEMADFPQYYKSFFGKMVGRYLVGEFGTAKQVNPYLASVLYAGDRWEAKEKINKWLTDGRIVVSNRYVSANQIHQTGKIKGKKKKENFLKWLEEMEYKVFGIQKPSLVLFLNVPYKVGQRLVIKKGTRKYIGGVKHDIHEGSKSHLTAAQKQVFELADKFIHWKKIDCVEGKKLCSRQEIADKIWKIVSKKI